MHRRTPFAVSSARHLACLAGIALAAGAALAADPVPYTRVDLSLDTGAVSPTPAALQGWHNDMELVHSQMVEVEGGSWIRLYFDVADLAPGAVVRITSALDGHQQTLDADAIAKWSNSTAYFNGPAVAVDVIAPAGSGPSRVVIGSADVGEPVEFNDDIRTICGPTDDRLPSYEARSARLMPIGCTAWLFNNRPNSVATAAHCGPGGGDVVQFNVPLSSSSGSTLNPPPEHQYPVDNSSVEDSSGISLGNDWAVFGVFNNTSTGLSPVDAQLDSYVLGTATPPSDGRSIRLTGYGSTSGSAPGAWYLFQKTHTGPFVSTSGSSIRYGMDTTGGNSGSAVVDDTTGLTFGIHTNGGCSSSGGANSGTSISNTAFRQALMRANGTQAGPVGAVITTESARPTRIDPAGGNTIDIRVRPDFTGPAPQTGATLHVVDSTGEQTVAMAQTGAGTYTGTFPAVQCGEDIGYYFSVTAADGSTVTFPPSAPSVTIPTRASEPFSVVAAHDFQSADGWSVTNEAITTGGWEIATPTDPSRGAPHQDFDGSGACFVTQNGGTNDVDGGPTRLISPVYDLTGTTDPWIDFAAWVMNGASGDDLYLDFSDNGGATWTNVDRIASTPAWNQRRYTVSDHVTPNANFRVRFSIADNPNNSSVEAAVDAFSVSDWACTTGPQPCSGADLAEPAGELNIDDVLAFVDAFAFGTPEADLAKPLGELNIDDVLAFLDIFAAGCP